MKCKYSITFEFDVEQPITVKGEAKGVNVRTVAARALDDATDKNPGVKWSSLVILLIRNEDKEIADLTDDEKHATISS